MLYCLLFLPIELQMLHFVRLKHTQIISELFLVKNWQSEYPKSSMGHQIIINKNICINVAKNVSCSLLNILRTVFYENKGSLTNLFIPVMHNKVNNCFFPWTNNLRSMVTPLHGFVMVGLPTPSWPVIAKKLVAFVDDAIAPFDEIRSSVRDDEYRLCRVVP